LAFKPAIRKGLSPFLSCLRTRPDLIVGGPPCQGISVMDLFSGAGEVALSFYSDGIYVMCVTRATIALEK